MGRPWLTPSPHRPPTAPIPPAPCFIREHNVSPWSPASRDVLCDSRCKENEQAAESRHKKSALSQALKGLPERGHMHLKKYPSGSPPCRPQPALTQPSTDAAQRGPQARQGRPSSRLTAGQAWREGSQRHRLPPGKFSTLVPCPSWNPGSRGAGSVSGNHWPRPLNVQVTTPRPRIGEALQLDRRCQAARVPRSPTSLVPHTLGP